MTKEEGGRPIEPYRILLVEDALDQAHLMQFLLENEAHARVTVIQDGLKGCRFARDRSWDLVISDINLPGADGLQVMMASRESHPDTPILATTAYTSPEYAQQALRSGADDFLQKPIDREDLLEKVFTLLRRSDWAAEGKLVGRIEPSPAIRRDLSRPTAASGDAPPDPESRPAVSPDGDRSGDAPPESEIPSAVSADGDRSGVVQEVEAEAGDPFEIGEPEAAVGTGAGSATETPGANAAETSVADAGTSVAGATEKPVADAETPVPAADLHPEPMPGHVLAIGARPGDVEGGCGGSLLQHRARGDSVAILTFIGKAGAPESRKAEAKRAGRRIGASLVTGNVVPTSPRAEAEMEELVRNVVREFRPEIIYTHTLHDGDDEHQAAHRATLAGAPGVARIYGYQTESSTVEFHPTVFVDVSEQLEAKVDLIAEYDFQEDEAQRVDPGLVNVTARYWGKFSGHPRAEPLEVLRAPEAGDAEQAHPLVPSRES